MTTYEITVGNYSTKIKSVDGGFQVTFLFNINSPTHSFSDGDVSDIKTYKTEKMAISKARSWLKKKNQ